MMTRATMSLPEPQFPHLGNGRANAPSPSIVLMRNFWEESFHRGHLGVDGNHLQQIRAVWGVSTQKALHECPLWLVHARSQLRELRDTWLTALQLLAGAGGTKRGSLLFLEAEVRRPWDVEIPHFTSVVPTRMPRTPLWRGWGQLLRSRARAEAPPGTSEACCLPPGWPVMLSPSASLKPPVLFRKNLKTTTTTTL